MSSVGIAITVNGEEHLVEPGSTVASLLDTLGTERRGVAVAVDGEVVSRSAWDGRELGGGEHVEILSGLQPGQRVVTEGVVKLGGDSQKIRVAGAEKPKREGN